MGSLDSVGLLIAALGGTAVGLERQWSGHANGPDARFAGIRTFTMLGALVVLAAGVLSSAGSIRLASAIIALETLILVEKSRLHALVTRIDDIGLRSAVRFAAMALVILPLLPQGPFGPFGGVRPRELWALMLFFSGLSFAGYLARRIIGPGRGYLVTGLLGGLVSSTNVTLTYARTSRTDPVAERALALGAVAANAMLYPRVLVATAILNPAVFAHVARYLSLPALIAVLVAATGVRRSSAGDAPDLLLRNPLQLVGALQMVVMFQVVLMVVHLLREIWGETGVFTSAAVLGLTDVDALTLSMARGLAQSVSPPVAGHRYRRRRPRQHGDEACVDDTVRRPTIPNHHWWRTVDDAGCPSGDSDGVDLRTVVAKISHLAPGRLVRACPCR